MNFDVSRIKTKTPQSNIITINMYTDKWILLQRHRRITSIKAHYDTIMLKTTGGHPQGVLPYFAEYNIIFIAQ